MADAGDTGLLLQSREDVGAFPGIAPSACTVARLCDEVGVLGCAVDADDGGTDAHGAEVLCGDADGAERIILGDKVGQRGAVAFVCLMVGGAGGQAPESDVLSHGGG